MPGRSLFPFFKRPLSLPAPQLLRAVSTSVPAARRRGDDAMVQPHAWREKKRDVMPPPGWDHLLVDRIVTATASDVMRRPCVTKPKPDEMVHYVHDTDTVKACAKIFWEKRIGALMVKSATDGSVQGIMSERDFVKALATDTTHECKIRDLMTPASKMITVSLTTGVGECMELMRKHGIRHLPVMAVSRREAAQNLQGVAERCAHPPMPRLTPPIPLRERRHACTVALVAQSRGDGTQTVQCIRAEAVRRVRR